MVFVHWRKRRFGVEWMAVANDVAFRKTVVVFRGSWCGCDRVSSVFTSCRLRNHFDTKKRLFKEFEGVAVLMYKINVSRVVDAFLIFTKNFNLGLQRISVPAADSTYFHIEKQTPTLAKRRKI